MLETDAAVLSTVADRSPAQLSFLHVKKRGGFNMILQLAMVCDGNVDAVSAGHE
jgi:hypothetical protein